MNETTEVDSIATIAAKNSLTVRDRLYDVDGDIVTRSGISSLSVKVFNTRTGVETYSATITVASALYNSLVTSDDAWEKDAIGYNFKHTIPGTAFPDGGQTYQVEYLFTPTSGNEWTTNPPIRVKTSHRYTS